MGSQREYTVPLTLIIKCIVLISTHIVIYLHDGRQYDECGGRGLVAGMVQMEGCELKTLSLEAEDWCRAKVMGGQVTQDEGQSRTLGCQFIDVYENGRDSELLPRSTPLLGTLNFGVRKTINLKGHSFSFFLTKVSILSDMTPEYL